MSDNTENEVLLTEEYRAAMKEEVARLTPGQRQEYAKLITEHRKAARARLRKYVRSRVQQNQTRHAVTDDGEEAAAIRAVLAVWRIYRRVGLLCDHFDAPSISHD